MSSRALGLAALVLCLATRAALGAQEPIGPAPQAHTCEVDLRSVGGMEDVLSNALYRGLGQDRARVRRFLPGAREGCANGDELLRRAAAEFGLDEQVVAAEVERYRHVNCGAEAPADGSWTPASALTPFAADVTLHVVLHELGHALIREFDLPVLGNEETMADAFATHYLTTHLPERAPAARTRSPRWPWPPTPSATAPWGRPSA